MGAKGDCRAAHRGSQPRLVRMIQTMRGGGRGARRGPPRCPRHPVPQSTDLMEGIGEGFGSRHLPFAKPALAADGRSMRLAHRPPPGGVVAPPGPPQCTPHVPWMVTIFRVTAAIFCVAQKRPKGPQAGGLRFADLPFRRATANPREGARHASILIANAVSGLRLTAQVPERPTG